jgi:xyloglucan-specific endo-beta-1,4-glucanase
MPISIPNTTSLELSAVWSVTATDADLNSANTGMVADISWDIFADPDPVKAQSDINSAYEIMIWLGHYGGAAPIGWDGNQCDGVENDINGNIL